MSPVDLLTYGVWLLAGLGLWLIRKALDHPPKDRLRYRFGTTGLLLIIIPLSILLVAFFRHSAAVMATEYAFVAGFGVLMLIGAWRADMARYKLIFIVLLGFASLGWGLWHLAGDFLLRRPSIEGYVSEKRFETRRPSCTRCLPDYYVVIGSRRYLATARVFQAIETGERIRAKVGRASRRILWFEVRPF